MNGVVVFDTVFSLLPVLGFESDCEDKGILEIYPTVCSQPADTYMRT